MTTREKLMDFLQEGAANLEAYLLSDILYWQLPGEAAYQRFTLGGLLLGLVQINAQAETGQRGGHLSAVQASIDRLKLQRHSAWEKKVRQETAARLRLWKAYLEEYRQNPEEQAAYYPREVKWRVIIQLLIDDSPPTIEHVEMLTGLDKMVKSNWLPGAFAWEPYLVNSFPEPEYWFLYGRLKVL